MGYDDKRLDALPGRDRELVVLRSSMDPEPTLGRFAGRWGQLQRGRGRHRAGDEPEDAGQPGRGVRVPRSLILSRSISSARLLTYLIVPN